MRGRFITFEGGEGVGKTTQLKRVADWLRGRDLSVTLTREPGGTPRAERLREILLERDSEPMPGSCELLLMFAARASHLENLIRPAVARGEWVLCDRYTDATYAYQGGGRGVPVHHIDALAGIVHPDFNPDRTILLDLPVELGLARARHRNGLAGPDRFEAEEQAFFERVRMTYLERARAEPQRFQVVDASAPPEKVTHRICEGLATLIESSR